MATSPAIQMRSAPLMRRTRSRSLSSLPSTYGARASALSKLYVRHINLERLSTVFDGRQQDVSAIELFAASLVAEDDIAKQNFDLTSNGDTSSKIAYTAGSNYYFRALATGLPHEVRHLLSVASEAPVQGPPEQSKIEYLPPQLSVRDYFGNVRIVSFLRFVLELSDIAIEIALITQPSFMRKFLAALDQVGRPAPPNAGATLAKSLMIRYEHVSKQLDYLINCKKAAGDEERARLGLLTDNDVQQHSDSGLGRRSTSLININAPLMPVPKGPKSLHTRNSTNPYLNTSSKSTSPTKIRVPAKNAPKKTSEKRTKKARDDSESSSNIGAASSSYTTDPAHPNLSQDCASPFHYQYPGQNFIQQPPVLAYCHPPRLPNEPNSIKPKPEFKFNPTVNFTPGNMHNASFKPDHISQDNLNNAAIVVKDEPTALQPAHRAGWTGFSYRPQSSFEGKPTAGPVFNGVNNCLASLSDRQAAGPDNSGSRNDGTWTGTKSSGGWNGMPAGGYGTDMMNMGANNTNMNFFNGGATTAGFGLDDGRVASNHYHQPNQNHYRSSNGMPHQSRKFARGGKQGWNNHNNYKGNHQHNNSFQQKKRQQSHGGTFSNGFNGDDQQRNFSEASTVKADRSFSAATTIASAAGGGNDDGGGVIVDNASFVRGGKGGWSLGGTTDGHVEASSEDPGGDAGFVLVQKDHQEVTKAMMDAVQQTNGDSEHQLDVGKPPKKKSKNNNKKKRQAMQAAEEQNQSEDKDQVAPLGSQNQVQDQDHNQDQQSQGQHHDQPQDPSHPAGENHAPPPNHDQNQSSAPPTNDQLHPSTASQDHQETPQAQHALRGGKRGRGRNRGRGRGQYPSRGRGQGNARGGGSVAAAATTTTNDGPQQGGGGSGLGEGAS